MLIFGRARAFTLGEVLITLIIIGVIAALTIPSLIQETQQKDMKAAFKKAVSTLNKAIELGMIQDGADTNKCDDCNSNATALALYFISKLNVISQNTSTTMPYFYTTDGMKFTVIKNDGLCGVTSTSIDPVNATCIMIVDVNGNKSPNVESSGDATYKDQYRLVVRKRTVVPAENSEYQVAMNILKQ